MDGRPHKAGAKVMDSDELSFRARDRRARARVVLASARARADARPFVDLEPFLDARELDALDVSLRAPSRSRARAARDVYNLIKLDST